MFGLGLQELVVIFVVALLVFGPKRLPEIARNLGKSLAEFRRASNDLRRSIMEPELPPAAPRGPADEVAAAALPAQAVAPPKEAPARAAEPAATPPGEPRPT